MIKIGEMLSSTRAVINKRAFVPNPDAISQQQQPMLEQISQLAQSSPPEVQQQVQQAVQQIQQMPPEHQTQALQELGQQLSQQGGGAQGQAGAQPQADSQDGGQQPGAPGGQPGQEGGPAVTDLENTTVTLKLRELLDLTSGGKATGSAMKAQEHVHKFNAKKQQMEQDAQMNQQKAEQQAQQVATQQDAAMAANGPNMMGQGGVY